MNCQALPWNLLFCLESFPPWTWPNLHLLQVLRVLRLEKFTIDLALDECFITLLRRYYGLPALYDMGYSLEYSKIFHGIFLTGWLLFIKCTSRESLGFKGGCNDDYQSRLNKCCNAILFREFLLESERVWIVVAQWCYVVISKCKTANSSSQHKLLCKGGLRTVKTN